MLIYLQIIETDEDKSTFEQIYEAYRGLMFHAAFKVLTHEQDAEDAVHYAFVKIAENGIRKFLWMPLRTAYLYIQRMKTRSPNLS